MSLLYKRGHWVNEVGKKSSGIGETAPQTLEKKPRKERMWPDQSLPGIFPSLVSYAQSSSIWPVF